VNIIVLQQRFEPGTSVICNKSVVHKIELFGAPGTEVGEEH